MNRSDGGKAWEAAKATRLHVEPHEMRQKMTPDNDNLGKPRGLQCLRLEELKNRDSVLKFFAFLL